MPAFGRRDILKASAALAAASAAPPLHAGPGRKPNIIFILADDLGFADLSCYGRRDYETPEIDKLARQGMRFLQAYANSAVCSATRTALITGRYQNRLKIGLEEPLAGRDVGLPPEHPTLPSLLRNAGYQTALVGKWHLGKLPKYGPLKSGYDHFWGMRGGAVDYYTHGLLGRADLWDDDREISEKGYLTDLLGDKAIEMVEHFRMSARPFFLSLHFNAPHWPWETAEDPQGAARLANARTLHAAEDFDGGSLGIYAQIVRRMDFQVGRLLARLDQLDLANDTIVIFTSDNGGERYSDTWPFSGMKTELLEGGLRVPAIIRWPGVVSPGATSEQVTMSMDWLPTLLAAANAGTDPNHAPDGIDLIAALRGGPSAARTLCWRYLNNAQEACRSGDWKYLKIRDNRFIFNVVDDPLERANMKERRPDIFADLQARYAKWNAAMLPLDPDVSTAGFSGADVADHFGMNGAIHVDPAVRPN
jgi:arylsulfatase A-like enzyme